MEIKGGVIDLDYTGNIKIILHNFCHNDFTVKQSDHVAQLILEQYLSPQIKVTSEINLTERNTKGFGSTGMGKLPTTSNLHMISYEQDELDLPVHINAASDTTTLNGASIKLIFTKPVNTTTITIQYVARRYHYVRQGTSLKEHKFEWMSTTTKMINLYHI